MPLGIRDLVAMAWENRSTWAWIYWNMFFRKTYMPNRRILGLNSLYSFWRWEMKEVAKVPESQRVHTADLPGGLKLWMARPSWEGATFYLDYQAHVVDRLGEVIMVWNRVDGRLVITLLSYRVLYALIYGEDDVAD